MRKLGAVEGEVDHYKTGNVAPCPSSGRKGKRIHYRAAKVAECIDDTRKDKVNDYMVAKVAPCLSNGRKGKRNHHTETKLAPCTESVRKSNVVTCIDNGRKGKIKHCTATEAASCIDDEQKDEIKLYTATKVVSCIDDGRESKIKHYTATKVVSCIDDGQESKIKHYTATKAVPCIDDGRRSKKNHYTTVDMAPCKVCGRKSTGYHFGAITCEACKAFFRRTLGKTSSVLDRCQRGSSKCGDDPASITGCPACRLQRCREQGMSKGGARKGRYSMELRTKSIIEAKRHEIMRKGNTVQGGEDNSSRDRQLDGRGLKVNETETQENFKHPSEIDPRATLTGGGRDSNMYAMARDRHGDMVESTADSGITRSMDCDINASCGRSLQSERSQHASYKIYIEDNSPQKDNPAVNCLRSTTQSSSPMCFLPEEVSILEDIIDDLVHLQDKLFPHQTFTHDIELRQRQIEEEHSQREETYRYMFGTTEYVSASEFREVLTAMNMELDERLTFLREKAIDNEKNIVLYVKHSKLIPGFDTLDLDDVLHLLKESYYEFWLFSNHIFINGKTGISGGNRAVLNAHKKIVSSLFPKTYVDAIFSFADTLSNLKLTLEEVAIIRVIVLTFTDRCSLHYPERVQKLHDLFTKCLLYHLCKSIDNYRHRFCLILECLVEVRTLTHMNRSVNEKFLKDWSFVMKDYPLWREMMSVAPKHM